MILKFSEKHEFMIGIVFVLRNREEKRLNFFLDKDLTPIDCLADDTVVMKEWSADDD